MDIDTATAISQARTQQQISTAVAVKGKSVADQQGQQALELLAGATAIAQEAAKQPNHAGGLDLEG